MDIVGIDESYWRRIAGDQKKELERLYAQVARLRAALLPLLDELGGGSDMDYHMRTDGHAERLQAALSDAADDWLTRHDEEVKERCLARRFPMPLRAIRNLLSPVQYSHDAQVVRTWLDNITGAIREATTE